MPDRLAFARRAFIDTASAAAITYADAMGEVELKWRAAALQARRGNTKLTREFVSWYLKAGWDARAAYEQAVAATRAEVRAAIAEARANGTFHWNTAPRGAPPS